MNGSLKRNSHTCVVGLLLHFRVERKRADEIGGEAVGAIGWHKQDGELGPIPSTELASPDS